MLTGIELGNFRNYADLQLPFDRPANIFIGANGQGKTNLLEAIFFLSLLRSFRTSSLRDLCRSGSTFFKIAGELRSRRSHGTRRLDVMYGEKRRLWTDGQPVHASADFIGQFRVVAFTPEDARMIYGPPPLRRRFLDMALATVDTGYLHALQEYDEALRARNLILRKTPDDFRRTASAFETIMATNGAAVVAARRRLVGSLQTGMTASIGQILGRKVSFQLRYQTQSGTEDVNAFQERLAADRERDRERGHTGYGPHLDDLLFMLEGHDLRHHGSTGQCRLGALCLKIAVIQWYQEIASDGLQELMVLVDDVTGELDEPTRNAFMASLQVADQLFITLTGSPPPAGLFPGDAAHFKIDGGIVTAF